MKAIAIRGPYYDTKKASLAAGFDNKNEPTMTQQHYKDQTDINRIVERFLSTGELPQAAVLPTYADYEGVFDFQTAQNALVAGNRAFMSLPAKMRARFENDPQKYMEFCTNEENRDELKKMGLLKPEKQPTLEPWTELKKSIDALAPKPEEKHK